MGAGGDDKQKYNMRKCFGCQTIEKIRLEWSQSICRSGHGKERSR